MANYNYVPSEQVKLQQRMAEELMATPMRQGLRGGQPTDWGRGLAHMLRQWQGGKQLREAKEQAEFNTDLRQKEVAELIRGTEMQAGMGDRMQQLGSNLPQFTPKQGGTGQMPSGDSLVSDMGEFQMAVNPKTPEIQDLMLAQKLKKTERDEGRDYDAKLLREKQRNDQLVAAQLQQSKLDQIEATPTSLGPQQQSYDSEGNLISENTNQYSSGLGGSSARVRTVNTVEHGLVKVFPDDGRVEDMSGNVITTPIHRTQDDPELVGQIAKSRVTGKEEGKREFNMQGATSMLDMAEAILGGTTEEFGDETPTASGIGSAVDWAGRVFGKSFEGAVPAAKLEMIGGWLVSRVPRMEGPQSDYDALNYKTMAASVGDRTKPIAERTAALQGLRTIFSQYEVGEDGVLRSKKLQAGASYIRDENGKLVRQE